MSIQNALASLAVEHFDHAVRWYEKLLGRAADSRPMANVAEWEFPRGGWLQVYGLPERAGKGSITLAVDDIVQQAAALDALGIAVDRLPPDDQVDVLMIKDPDGNSIAFAQAHDPRMAR